MSQYVGNTSLLMAKSWHHYDVKGKVLGRVAVDIALTLMGKKKPYYEQTHDHGDYVVVTNARHIHVTGRKEQQKTYHKHSTYPGGHKWINFASLMEKKPELILRKAVRGMLPKNTFQDRRLDRLLIFPDDDHPYRANITKRYDLGDAYEPNPPPSSAQLPKRGHGVINRF